MTLATLKSVCATYHAKTTGDLTVDSVDLFLVAANNARRNAELLHNFEDARVQATLVIDGVTGGALTAAVFDYGGDAMFSGIKEIVGIGRVSDGGSVVPLDFANPSVLAERDRTEIELSADYWFGNRYPSDRDLQVRGSSSSLIQRGDSIFVYPASNATSTPLSVTIEGYGWLKDYATTADTDFFVQYGHRFLQWSIINELNYLFKTFVPRTEGNLSAPEKERDMAWRDLLLWDTYKVNSNMTRSR